MALLGLGMGLIASQLGNVVQSSVDASGRSEAGGLQYTAQQLGSSLGVALIGAIVLSGLTSNFVDNIEADDRIAAEVTQQVSVAAGTGRFRLPRRMAAAAQHAGLDSGHLPPRSSTTTSRHRSSRSRPACWRRRCWRCCPSPSPGNLPAPAQAARGRCRGPGEPRGARDGDGVARGGPPVRPGRPRRPAPPG